MVGKDEFGQTWRRGRGKHIVTSVEIFCWLREDQTFFLRKKRHIKTRPNVRQLHHKLAEIFEKTVQKGKETPSIGRCC